jgi:hypothetical protein
VDFFVFGFDIAFGNSDPRPGKVNLQGFSKLLLQQATSTQQTSVGTGLTLSPSAGAIPKSGQSQIVEPFKPGDVWNVRGGQFVFTISSIFAIKNASVAGGGSISDSMDIFARPMQLEDGVTLHSDLSITITQNVEGVQEQDNEFRMSGSPSPVPVAMWGRCKSSRCSPGRCTFADRFARLGARGPHEFHLWRQSMYCVAYEGRRQLNATPNERNPHFPARTALP